MACKATFDLYHNFPKLAEEAGFVFNTHRPRVQIEWNKIRLLDIESLIRERKFILIEQHLNDILDCVLESEFDVRILDEGVVKIFRLAQLAVEYQQFCRHYLDRSVYVLREEVTSLAKELEAHKRSLREKDDDIRRFRRKSKHVIRTPLPYGNENIATMILNTLKNQSDIFPSAPHLDTIHHNKCQYCEKVFLNQFYLKSHISRRHPNITEIPQKDVVKEVSENYPEDNNKLHIEIENLKTKLKEMETVISETHKSNEVPKTNMENKSNEVENVHKIRKEMKDAEVLTHNEGYLSDRIEEFKKQEFDKYNKELSSLRAELMHLIVSNKDEENQNTKAESDEKLIEQLEMTIKQQGAELLTLKQELLNLKCMKDVMETERKKDVEVQLSHWVKKVEAQSNECKMLLEKLNETAKQVHQYKTLANAEREKALQLQEFLNKQLQVGKTNNLVGETSPLKLNDNGQKSKLKINKCNPTADRVTLEKLQKQAQDLLNIEQSTTETSTSSGASNDIPETKKLTKDRQNEEVLSVLKTDKHYEKSSSSNRSNFRMEYKHKHKKLVSAKDKMKSLSLKENGQAPVPISPVKVVRAKITEEVNQRLVQLGVDPLKNRLPKNTFHKQRTMLQAQQELKAKKYPSREKIYHSIMTHLDTNTTIPQEKVLQRNSPGKANKTFSISSVISNVKTKALSLVKPNEVSNNKNYNKTTHSVTDKALALLKTSQNSLQSSPKNIKDVKSSISPFRYETEKKEGKVRHRKKELSKFKLTTNNKSGSSDGTESETSDHSQKSFNMESKSISPKHQTTQSSYKKISDDIYKGNLFNGTRDINNRQKTDIPRKQSEKIQECSSDDIESLDDNIMSPRKAFSEESLNPKQTKGVLRNASSTSSLNKKKVLFDMDAIQMKSISASPSQSFAEKSENNEKYTLGIINLDTEEWDPSSIEIENPINPTIQVSSRTTPRIAELKQVIESQMARRIQTPSTALAGSVNVLPTPKPMVRTSLGGSNTSLGSSILDESENLSLTNQNLKVSKRTEKKDDSEIDFSELLADDKDDQKF